MVDDIRNQYLEMMRKYTGFNESYWTKIDTSNHCPIYIAITSSRKPAFLFDVPESCKNVISGLVDTAGYKRYVDKNPKNGYIRSGIEAVNEDSFEVFFIVVSDLIAIASEEKDSYFMAIIERLSKWSDFFRNAKTGILDRDKQIGLFGELCFIQEEIRNGYSHIVKDWRGPLRDVKDFIIGDTAVEIKTSIINATNRIHISDENQLDDSGFSQLFLNVRILMQNQMDGMTLPELIDSIKDEVEDNQSLIDEIDEKLMHSGYREEFRDQYINRYEQTDYYWFVVHDTDDIQFPRIIPSDLASGVRFVNYQIELSSLHPFSADWMKIRDTVEVLSNE
ncbi:MAG: PD-(D/E)XK motif protein [Candidatus Ornithospirochaeta sp.]|nr:PD-(D/E)XK motif protein [Candidatus Ornithospirochaeta sp.]